MTWTLPEPMLTTPVASPALPPGAAAEPKWDGYRAQLARYADGRVLLRSRQGTDMTAAFPEIAGAALAQLLADTGRDGELVVWEGERLAFERLQRMARRRGAGALKAARTWPAHLVVFDVLCRQDLLHRPEGTRHPGRSHRSDERDLLHRRQTRRPVQQARSAPSPSGATTSRAP